MVDIVRAIKAAVAHFPLLDTLEVRPGLDGVCEGGRCLTAWQLALGEVFSENHPLPSIPEASFGFSTEAVRKSLGSSAPDQGRGIEGFLRIETDSMSADIAEKCMIRSYAHYPAGAKSRVGHRASRGGAQHYIVEPQEDGSFRYSLDPTTGEEDSATLNLPRQAGTTYALCELGKGKELRGTVARALAAFGPRETNSGDVSALVDDNGEYGLGKSALPLLAMLRCRELVGSDNDRLIGQLSRLILKLQREKRQLLSGVRQKRARWGRCARDLVRGWLLVLALVLFEQQLASLKGSAAELLPDAGQAEERARPRDELLRRAVLAEAAAGFSSSSKRVGTAWRRATRSPRTETTAGEQLCIDYVGSRQPRYVARASRHERAQLRRRLRFQERHVSSRSNTATSGFGEALDAAITHLAKSAAYAGRRRQGAAQRRRNGFCCARNGQNWLLRLQKSQPRRRRLLGAARLAQHSYRLRAARDVGNRARRRIAVLGTARFEY